MIITLLMTCQMIMGGGKIMMRCGSWVSVDHGAFKIESSMIIFPSPHIHDHHGQGQGALQARGTRVAVRPCEGLAASRVSPRTEGDVNVPPAPLPLIRCDVITSNGM